MIELLLTLSAVLLGFAMFMAIVVMVLVIGKALAAYAMRRL